MAWYEWWHYGRFYFTEKEQGLMGRTCKGYASDWGQDVGNI